MPAYAEGLRRGPYRCIHRHLQHLPKSSCCPNMPHHHHHHHPCPKEVVKRSVKSLMMKPCLLSSTQPSLIWTIKTTMSKCSSAVNTIIRNMTMLIITILGKRARTKLSHHPLQSNAEVDWSGSGNTQWCEKLARHFILLFPFICHQHVKHLNYYTAL